MVGFRGTLFLDDVLLQGKDLDDGLKVAKGWGKGGREGGGVRRREGGRGGEGGVLPWLMATKKRAPTKF